MAFRSLLTSQLVMKKTIEILVQYFTLGLISFGGPAAHVGYFHKVFVEQRKWLDDAAYARLLSLSQLLPGPGSSQMGFAIGLHRAGILGGFAAFFAFTLPSFLLMYLLASSNAWLSKNTWFAGVVDGLKLLAVVVVADATLKMFRKFCTRKAAIGIAVFTAAFLLTSASLVNQVLVLVIAAIAGNVCYHAETDVPQPLKASTQLKNDAQSRSQKQPHQKAPIGWVSLSLFFGLLLALSTIPFTHAWGQLFAQFYQAGSLVFGGGHVVLPLLQEIIGEQISQDRFLMGYAAAQAVPGPMFSLAAFLGAELAPHNTAQSQFWGAMVASAGIFLPGFLLVIALHGAWESIAQKPKVAGAVWGINAAVVGLLITALYHPVFTSTITKADNASLRMAVVLLGFFALQQLNVKIVWLVLAFAGVGVGLNML